MSRAFFHITFIAVLSLVAMFVFAQNENVVEIANKSTIARQKNGLFEFDNGWWRLNESGQKEARISQCGFYCSLFVLEYFDKSFSPSLVCENLHVSGRQVQFEVVLRRDPLVTVTPNTISIPKEQKGAVKIQACDFVKSRIKDVKIHKLQDDNVGVTRELQRISRILKT